MKHRPCKYPKRRCSTSWGKLPLPVLAEIMHYLSDSDKVSCAQVCRHWYIAFVCPMLWREREFEFGGSRFRPLGQRSVIYAKKFGKYLRQLIIICRQLTSHTCETMMGNLQAFLESLVECGPPVLHFLHIEGLELEFWRYGNLRDQVANMLIQFFRTQRKLKTFCMPHAQFALLPGIDVLDAIADGNGDNLEMLLIDFFFQSRLPVCENNRFHGVMEKFSNLTRVELNYCYLSEGLVAAWAKSLRGKLMQLYIKCHEAEPNAHVIPNMAWSSLVTACPKLQVSLELCGVGRSTVIIPILATALPLTNLQFFTGFDNGNEFGLSSILNHLVAYHHEKLRHLNLESDNYHDDIDDALMAVATRCRHLTFLKIKAQMDVQVARYICRLLEEGRTSLVTVDLMLCDISPMEVEQLNQLRADMSYIMEMDGVELIIRDDLYQDAVWNGGNTELVRVDHLLEDV